MNFSWYDKMIPYGILGLGFYVPSFVDPTASAPQPSASSSQSQSIPSISAVLFGIHVGTGIDLALSKNIFFGTSLMLNQMFGTTKTLASGAPSNVGGAYATFFLHMGTTF